ncbi:MAG: GH92 family glycosyl hydrolase [Bacteroidales bacterium]|jgi:predicted alpha-1,2-mannosidase|nr:GH92 family glycosyl hydrolase [Bacteroidales bacterium]
MKRNIIILSVLYLLLSTSAYCRQPADYVDPVIDTKHPRWIFFGSACRPFSMVALSPDTKTMGTWGGGYVYGESHIRCFSHIHSWQMSGIPVMPTTGAMKGHLGFEANKSSFSHEKETVQPGYHQVVLDDYGITAELTSTCRVGFHRYTFPAGQPGNILFDVGASLGHGSMDSASIRVTGEKELSGFAVMSKTGRRQKPCTVYFVVQLNQAFDQFGGWKKNDRKDPEKILVDANKVSGIECGGYITFNQTTGKPVLMKVALSFVSEEQAKMNLNEELPKWNFDQVRKESYKIWNEELGKIKIEGGTEQQRVKFYTDLFHANLGRRTFSDVNGKYIDNTGNSPVVRQVELDGKGKPVRNTYSTDAFWGTEWNLNVLWSFVYPQVLNDFIANALDYYKNGGLIARGPSGGNYTYVMVGDQMIPLIAAAYNKGIRNYDLDAAFEGSIKNSEPGGIRDYTGYGLTPGEHMKYYIERGYVPEGVRGSGMHRGGCALTLHFAYEDWCMAQLAKGMGKQDVYDKYMARSVNYKNVFDPEVGWMRPRELDGSWYKDFQPVGEGFSAKGFVESNSAIYTYYVPHDFAGLIRLMGGDKAFTERLNMQFEKSAEKKYVAPHGHHSINWIDYENQPSCHMAHLFNYAKAPWMTQYWVRRVKEKAFGDTSPYGGYNGDEDQGQMGALGVLMAIGLFDASGGASVKPHYEITTPLFDKIEIALDRNYYSGKKFVIKTINNSPENIYIQSAKLNGKALDNCWFWHDDLVKGGTLELTLGPQPNYQWGLTPPPSMSDR